MSRRHYFCSVTGTGTSLDPFRPVAIPGGVWWCGTDARPDATVATGKMFVEADVTDTQHATIKATAGVTYLPFEDASGAALGDDDAVTSATTTARTQLRNRLEAAGVPVDDLIDGDLVRIWKRRLRLRLLLRQLLGGDDFPLTLDTLVSDLTVAQRQNIRTKLLTVGIDTTGAGIVGSDTIRQAIRKAIAVNGAPLFVGVA